jgi:hypothetical protein
MIKLIIQTNLINILTFSFYTIKKPSRLICATLKQACQDSFKLLVYNRIGLKYFERNKKFPKWASASP